VRVGVMVAEWAVGWIAEQVLVWVGVMVAEWVVGWVVE